jgi:uncharacterized membrane protein
MSAQNAELDPPQSIGVLVLIFGFLIVLVSLSDARTAQWWEVWRTGPDIIGIIAGLYMVFAGLVVAVVPPESRSEAIEALLSALRLTFRAIVIIARAIIQGVSDWERKRRTTKADTV